MKKRIKAERKLCKHLMNVSNKESMVRSVGKSSSYSKVNKDLNKGQEGVMEDDSKIHMELMAPTRPCSPTAQQEGILSGAVRWLHDDTQPLSN